MRIQPVLGSVVGMADDVHWGQVFLSPVAYGVVEVEDPRGRARDWGVKVLTRLSEETTHPPKSLKVVQEIAVKAMEETVTSLMLLVPMGSSLSVVLLGEGKVFLKRGDRVATLMDQPGAVSGQVEEGDTVILASRSVAGSLPQEAMRSLFDHLDAPAIAEKMTLLLHSREGISGSAALIFQVKGLQTIPSEEPARRRVPFTKERLLVPVTAILILVFIASVLLGVVKQRGQKVESRVARALSDAQHAFDEGVALLELNPVKGRERLTVARDGLVPLHETLSPSTREGKAVAKLYKDVSDALTVAMQITHTEPALFYDLSLLKAQAAITAFGQHADALALLDSRGLTVATLAVATKNAGVVAGGESYRGASLVAMHGDSVYTLVDGGIHRASASEGKTTPLVIKKDEQWGAIASLVSYGGNLYLLDTVKSRIWKYVAAEKSFSETREYLNPDTLPDLSQATGMAIDGGVWVGTRDGRMFHFVQGKEDTFAPRGVEPHLGKTLFVATTEEDKNLYVLDSDNKRVVVLDKNGIYLSQYVWTGALIPTQIAVSEKLKLILLLADGKLYSMELK